MNSLIIGATVLTYAALAAFFRRFHQRSRDRLFLIFAGAFAVLAVNRFLLHLLGRPEAHTHLFVVRLLAYALILWAIADKNRQGRAS